jgi:hypothetical protein
MEIQVFKQKFEDVLIDSLDKSFMILKSVILSDSEFRMHLIAQNQRYNQNEKDSLNFKIDQDKYSTVRIRITEGIKNLVDQLSDGDLEEDWWEIDIIKQSFQDDTLDLVDEDEISDISIQDLIQKGIDSIVLTNTKEIKPKEKVVELENLILDCQDALGVEKFDEAEKYCQLAKEIDFKSPQIYEYLAFIYFKKKTADEIIEEVVNGNGHNFKHIIQYTKRFHQFKDRYQSNFGGIGEESIRNIGRLLAQSIKNKYHKLDKGDKDLVWKCLQAYKQIFDTMLSPLVFLEFAITELSGGGIIPWLKLTNGKITNKWQGKYDALSLRKQFLERLSEYYKEKQPDLSEEEALDLANNRVMNTFFQQINRNYNRIHQEKNANGQYRWNRDHWKEVKQFMNASKIGYFLFDDKKFLLKPYEELNQKGKKFMPWLTLSNAGKLVTFHIARSIKFDALSELKFYAQELNLDFEEEKEKMRNALFNEMEERAERKYQYASGRISNPNPNLAKIREDIIYCLESYLLLAKDEKFTHKEAYLMTGIKELTGTEILNDWITILPSGELEAGDETKKLKFNAPEFLSKFLKIKSSENPNQPIVGIDEAFFDDIYQKTIVSYKSIEVSAPFDDDWEQERKLIIQYLRNLEMCFFTKPDKISLLPIIEELFNGGKLFWTTEDATGINNLSVCSDLGFDAVSFRDENLQRMLLIDPSFQVERKSKADLFKKTISSIFKSKFKINP